MLADRQDVEKHQRVPFQFFREKNRQRVPLQFFDVSQQWMFKKSEKVPSSVVWIFREFDTLFVSLIH